MFLNLRRKPSNSILWKINAFALASMAGVGMASFQARADGEPVSLKDAPPPPAEEYVWDGLYVGVGAGGASFDHSGEIDASEYDKLEKRHCWWGYCGIWKKVFSKYFEDGKAFSKDEWDVFGTAQIGYDRTINKRFLIGAFADIDFFPETDDTFSTGLFDHYKKFANVSGNIDLQHVWNVGGRLGFLVTPRILLYGDGGYSHANLDGSIDFDFGKGDPPVGLKIDDMEGFFVGGGAEVKISRNVSFKFEYRYTDLGDQSGSVSASDIDRWQKYCEQYKLTKEYGASGSLDAQVQSVRASLILKFGEPERPLASLK